MSGKGKFKNRMQKIFIWFSIYFCADCDKRIGPFSFAYDQPSWYRSTLGMGPFRNHIHCPACHEKSEKENGGDCQTCKNKV